MRLHLVGLIENTPYTMLADARNFLSALTNMPEQGFSPIGDLALISFFTASRVDTLFNELEKKEVHISSCRPRFFRLFDYA